MLADNLQQVKAEIAAAAQRSGRKPEEIKLIAVTKTVGVDQVRSAIELGLTAFGENRVQDAAAKVDRFPAAQWHFIGHLQSNKVRDVLPHYCLIHSLDRLSLAKAIQKEAEALAKKVEVLVQVNVSGEESKFGLAPADLGRFLDTVLQFKRISVRGLMTMAPFYDRAEEARPIFRKLRKLRDQQVRPGLELPELSMGMTNDFSVAVEEGATMVRIGSALFQNQRW